jgi:hypothetical protein
MHTLHDIVTSNASRASSASLRIVRRCDVVQIFPECVLHHQSLSDTQINSESRLKCTLVLYHNTYLLELVSELSHIN